MFTVRDPKNATSDVQVNKVLATVSYSVLFLMPSFKLPRYRHLGNAKSSEHGLQIFMYSALGKTRIFNL